ncbi:hypothetical protein [Bacillus cereus]|nr:hypothetical protein [Bacillus cereus]
MEIAIAVLKCIGVVIPFITDLLKAVMYSLASKNGKEEKMSAFT